MQGISYDIEVNTGEWDDIGEGIARYNLCSLILWFPRVDDRPLKLRLGSLGDDPDTLIERLVYRLTKKRDQLGIDLKQIHAIRCALLEIERP